MKKRAVIISNGKMKNKRFYRKLIKKTDYIICVDGGSKHAKKLNIVPRMIIGDLDSLDKPTQEYFLKKGVEIIRYNREKDKTDMQIAVELVMKLGFKEVLILCVFGDRLDHVLANVFLLQMLTERGIESKIIDEYNEIFLIKNSGKIRGKIGDIVSFISLTQEVNKIKTKGLKYELNNGKIKIFDTLGISNVLTKNTATINFKKGSLLVIKTKP
ncbi:MAG: thiamine diphosphokinase [Candidatus Aenigmarchaeota archaeon]|nr:thiamine diphosphokinase [Candidatus Aenigmarchaeota archaeon]